jgi:DNA transformation protein
VSALAELASMRNLGPASARMLHAAGITSAADLRSMGAVAAYVAVQRCGGKPSLNLLWALEGALTDRDWKAVSREDRTALLLALDDATRSRA